MAELLYKDLTEKIIKVFLEVFNHLGFGYSKDIYIEAMALEMASQGLLFERNKPVTILYKDNQIGKITLDFVNEEKVLLYIETNEKITEQLEFALMNQLRASKIEIGLVLNFGRRPEVRRKIYQNLKKTLKQKGETLDENRN